MSASRSAPRIGIHKGTVAGRRQSSTRDAAASRTITGPTIHEMRRWWEASYLENPGPETSAKSG